MLALSKKMGAEASVDRAYAEALEASTDAQKIAAMMGFSSSFGGETSTNAAILARQMSSWSNDKVLDLALAVRAITAPTHIGGGDGNNDESSSGRPNFEAFRSPHASTTGGFVFDIKERPADRMAAISAATFDARVSRFKPQLVPKYLTEVEYFYNYFSRVCAVRNAFFADAVDSEADRKAYSFRVEGETFDAEAPELDGKSFDTLDEFKTFIKRESDRRDSAAEGKEKEHAAAAGEGKVKHAEEEAAGGDGDAKSAIQVATDAYINSGGKFPPPLPRFIRCEKGDVEKGTARWQETLRFRAEYGMNTILDERDAKFAFIMKHYPHFFHGRSLGGHPVYRKAGEVNLGA